jgi:hypothetical protein
MVMEVLVIEVQEEHKKQVEQNVDQQIVKLDHLDIEEM